MGNHTSQRLVAGGMVAAAAMLPPVPAYAAADAAYPSPYVSFTLGCLTGAAVASSVAVALAARGGVLAGEAGPVGAHAAGATGSESASPARGSRFRVADSPSERGVRVQDVPSAAERPYVASVPVDYAEVAESYVRRQGMAERMAVRAAGVRDTLMSRLGADIFDDLPVIERADGTVGDVGTGWWEARMGGQIRREVIMDGPAPSEVARDDAPAPSAVGDDTAPLSSEEPERPAETTAPLERVDPKDVTAAGVAPVVRSAYIARKVAEVDLGAFPARRSAQELDASDEFDQALAAMDERLGVAAAVAAHAAPPFADSVGDAETIDDPTGLEPETGFIAFKVPAGHPEVVDAESYVDYLIADEFSSNPSRAARKSSGTYLRVIRGGGKAGTRGGSIGVGAGNTHRSGSMRPAGRHFRREYEAVAL